MDQAKAGFCVVEMVLGGRQNIKRATFVVWMAGGAFQRLLDIGMQTGLHGNFISYLRVAAQAQISLDCLQRLVALAAILFKFGV